MRYRTTAAAAGLAALLALTATACNPDGPAKKGTPEARERYAAGDRDLAPGPPEPSCDEAPRDPGVTGRVVASERTSDYELTCLEIQTATGHHKTIRVTRRVFDRCADNDPYPRCAHH